MSLFEPLFRGPERSRITPRSVPLARNVDQWMPIAVEIEAEQLPGFFDTDFDDPQSTSTSAAATRAAEAAAEAAAVHAEEIEAAYRRGVLDGQLEGERSEQARLRGAVLAAERALDDLRAGEARWLVNLEENIAAIAVAAAHQIVMHEVTMSPTAITETVARALQEFALDQALTIRVNPGDLQTLESADSSAPVGIATLTALRTVRWISDARIERGGCVVEGRERIVDGRVDTGLERLYRRLTHTNA